MQNIVIVAGGDCDLSLYKDMLESAYLIGADRGALYLADSGYKVCLATGDFDSVSEAELERIRRASDEVEKLFPDKDDTDLEHAINRALNLTAGTVHILGAIGSRLDQTFSAVNLLKLFADNGREAFIYDKNNRIRLVKGCVRLTKSRYRYVSLIPYGDEILNVSLKGFKYSGENIRLDRKTSLGISNEITDDYAEIINDGYLFVFESGD